VIRLSIDQMVQLSESDKMESDAVVAKGNDEEVDVPALRKQVVEMHSELQRLQKKGDDPALSSLQVRVGAWWQAMRKKYGDTDLVIGGTVGCHTAVYWGFGLMMFALDPHLQKWKLQPGKAPTKAMYQKLFKVALRNNGMLLLFAAIGRKLKLVQDHCKSMAEAPIPTLWRAVGEVVFQFTVNDVVFYFVHGLLHKPYFYKRIHKIHHEFKAPVALAAEYAHPLEYIFSNIIPGALGGHILGSHPLVQWLWLVVGILMTSIHHGGYVIPFYPLNEWALLHDWHHSSFYSNMGVTGLLDKAFGSGGGADYTDWRKEVIKRVKIPSSFLFWKHPIANALQVW